MLADFLKYVKSFALARALMTAIELNLFPLLQQGPLTRAELKGQLSIPDTSIADAYLDMLVAFQVLEEVEGKLALLPLSESVLPVYENIRSWNQEMLLFFCSLTNLTGVLKSGRYSDTALSDYWAYKKFSNRLQLQKSAVEDYSSVMDASQAQLNQSIMDHYDFSRHEHIIDFGGGYGRLAITLAEKYSNLKITVVDLPAVCEGTRKRVEAAGLANRVNCLPVDFFSSELPTGIADAILFVRVLHDWSDEEVARLLERTRLCLRRSGVVLVIEPIIDDFRVSSTSSATTALMLTLGGGKRRSVNSYMELLGSASYTQTSWRDCGLSIYKIITAQWPGNG